MSLSCDCEVDGAEWYYVAKNDFMTLATKRGRKCCSCKTKLSPGDTVLELTRSRPARGDFEISRWGEESNAYPIASWYMCEPCGGLYMAVTELGFCCDIQEPMRDQIAEWRKSSHDLHNPE